MEKLETELASLRARAETLSNRHEAADAAFVDAKSKLQRHLLEADLEDEKARAKLEAAVAACALTRDGYADALGEVQTQIVDVEQKIAAERAAVQRKAASEELARNLDEVEQVLPDYLESARRLASVLEAIHWHYEADEMSRFVGNAASQVEIAGAFSLQELRGMVNAIRDGAAPIPAPKPEPEPIAVIEPAPPTRTVFCLHSIKWKDGDGGQRTVMQYEDTLLPVALADKALRCGACVSISDERRKTLKGAHGGQHANPEYAIDLDAVEERSGASYIGPDAVDPVLRAADFRPLDRGGARTGTISIARLL